MKAKGKVKSLNVSKKKQKKKRKKKYSSVNKRLGNVKLHSFRRGAVCQSKHREKNLGWKETEIVASTKGFNAYVTRSKREKLNKTTITITTKESLLS